MSDWLYTAVGFVGISLFWWVLLSLFCAFIGATVETAIYWWERVRGKQVMEDEGHIHVYPINDLKEHVLEGLTCWCRPEENDDGVIVHNSLDRREEYENSKH